MSAHKERRERGSPKLTAKNRGIDQAKCCLAIDFGKVTVTQRLPVSMAYQEETMRPRFVQPVGRVHENGWEQGLLG